MHLYTLGQYVIWEKNKQTKKQQKNKKKTKTKTISPCIGVVWSEQYVHLHNLIAFKDSLPYLS